MSKKATFRVSDFSGGLNKKTNSTMIRDNQASNLLNCVIDGASVVKRNGCEKYNTNAIVANKPVYSITRFYKSNGSKYTIGQCGTKLSVIPSGSGAVTDLTSSLTDAAWVSYETYIDYLYMMNYSDGLFRTDGVTLGAAIAGAPSAKHIVSHSERMWAANVSANKSRVFWSGAFDPTDWTITDDYIEISQDDGDEVTGLVPFLDNLIVFKTNSIWMLTNTYDPDNEMQLVKRVTDNGCISPRSIVTLNNRIYFLSKNGVYEFDGVAARPISENVEPLILNINPSYQNKACAVAHKNKYILSYTANGSTSNQDQIVYDTIRKAWTQNDGKFARSNQMIVLNGGDDNGELLSATSNSTGLIYTLDSGTNDDGDAINFVYETKWFSMNAPEAKKKLKKIWAYASGSGNYNLEFTYFYDLQEVGTTIQIPLGGTGSEWGSMVWDTDEWGGLAITGDRQQAQGQGRFIKFKVASNSADEPVTVYGISALIRPKRAR